MGRSSFELAKHFKTVQGIDFSQAFVNRCNELKQHGQSSYCLPNEGEIVEKGMAEIPKEIVRFKYSSVSYITNFMYTLL